MIETVTIEEELERIVGWCSIVQGGEVVGEGRFFYQFE